MLKKLEHSHLDVWTVSCDTNDVALAEKVWNMLLQLDMEGNRTQTHPWYDNKGKTPHSHSFFRLTLFIQTDYFRYKVDLLHCNVGSTTVAFSSTCIEKTSLQQSNRADDRNSQSRWGKVRWIPLLNVIELYDIFRNIILCNLKRIFINSSSFLLLDPSTVAKCLIFTNVMLSKRKSLLRKRFNIDYVNDSSY